MSCIYHEGYDSKASQIICIDSSKLSRFYLLLMIHKGLSDVVGRPPVINNCYTAIELTSKYLDSHLNPLVS